MEISIYEFCATVSGVLYLYYASAQRPICWAFYIVSAIAYVPVFVSAQMYVYALFQLLFMVGGILGLLLWNSAQPPHRGASSLTLKGHFIALSLGALNFICMRVILDSAHIGSADLLLSIYTLVATVLTAQRYIESWHYWKIINAAGVIISIQSGLYLTALFFLINFVFSFIGHHQWQTDGSTRQSPE